MNIGIPKIRNFNNMKYGKAPDFIKDNWLKIVIILFALFILLKKDISFNFNLQSAGSKMHPTQSYEPRNASFSNNELAEAREVKSHFSETQTSKKTKQKKETTEVEAMDLPTFKVDKKKLQANAEKEIVKPTAKRKTKDNRANHFSNIAFILNPDYAKRKNIDREIVIQKNEFCFRYVKRYADVAVEEMNKYGIPASITLAQGLLESDAGGSRLSKANNNHFGIKCFSKKCSRNHCSNFTDDTHKDFFRKYKNVWQSYRAHSKFLQRKRYAHLQDLGTKDYKGWSHGLKKAGYATDKRYAEKLIKIIERMELYKYDA